MKTFLDPLSAEEERFLLEKMEQGDSEAKHRLIEHNMRLVAHVAKKYYGPNEDTEDLLSIGTIGLVKAVDTYNVRKGYKLATYAARCIDNELLMYFRGKKKQARDISLFEPIGRDKEGNQIRLYDVLEQDTSDIAEEMDKQNHISSLRYLVDEVLDAREKDIIVKRYGLGGENRYTQKQIAEKLNISRSYVSRIEKRGLEKLRIALENQ
ncbi:MAG: RNA polymerase sporulation sigma factor SigK [Lachnospiraceae bacterium]|nr:RNA polymerase sporulation sigma factor SigK [Lachnospiraceae bacterium]MDD6192550.1 RNA polymerase sporulation sigma factor SigK [Lachnospiraceae bacterium]MDY4794305.1 RNA polymerase sporulation sigma factor SigK [Pararoseburia sp.]